MRRIEFSFDQEVADLIKEIGLSGAWLIMLSCGAVTCPWQLWATYLFIVFKRLKNKLYKTTILPVVLYGSKIWSLILREKSGIRISENRILK